jgi:hypothetical protein
MIAAFTTPFLELHMRWNLRSTRWIFQRTKSAN